MRRVRKSLRWSRAVAAWVAVGFANPAWAQFTGYRIEADGCGPQASEIATVETSVFRIGGAGTPEAGGSYTQCTSSVDAASGEMSAAATLSRAGGTFATLPVVATGSFEERLWIYGLGPGETAIIDASLGLGGGASIGGATGSALVSGSLRVASCRITRTIRATGTVADTPNCFLADSFAAGDQGGVFMSVAIPYELLGPSPLGNYVVVSASVRGEVSNLNVPGVGVTEVGAQLGVSASGPAEFGFANPSTLTVPEPSAALAGLAAAGALAWRRRAPE